MTAGSLTCRTNWHKTKGKAGYTHTHTHKVTENRWTQSGWCLAIRPTGNTQVESCKFPDTRRELDFSKWNRNKHKLTNKMEQFIGTNQCPEWWNYKGAVKKNGIIKDPLFAFLFPSTCALSPFTFFTTTAFLLCPDKTQIPVVYTKANRCPITSVTCKMFPLHVTTLFLKASEGHNWKQADCVPSESQ